MRHFHWVDKTTGNQGGVTGLNGLYVVHSFYGDLLGVKL